MPDAARRLSAAPRLNGRRAYAVTLLAGLAASAAVTLAVSRPWLTADLDTPGLPTMQARVSGADLVPLSGAMGLVLLAGFGAVIATRGWVRRLVGLVVIAAALVVLVSAATVGPHDPALAAALSAKGWSGASAEVVGDSTAWRWLALIGAAVCAVAGGVVTRFGHRWPVMGSRYDAPDPARSATHPESQSQPQSPPQPATDEREIWKALDEGRDPTVDR